MVRRRGPYAQGREEALPGVRLHVARTAALGVSRANLAMWERGYHDVTYAHLVRLARLYRLDAAALFGDDLAPTTATGDTGNPTTGDARDDRA